MPRTAEEKNGTSMAQKAMQMENGLRTVRGLNASRVAYRATNGRIVRLEEEKILHDI
jgi:hypothetical protein